MEKWIDRVESYKMFFFRYGMIVVYNDLQEFLFFIGVDWGGF